VERVGGWWRNRFRAEITDPSTGEARTHELNRGIARVSEVRSRQEASRLLDAALAREGFEAVAPGVRIAAVEYSERFIREIVAGYRRTSARVYTRAIRADLQPTMGKLWLDELGASWLRPILASKGATHAQATVAFTRRVALQMLRQAGRDGYRVRPILPADVKLPKARTVLRERPFVTEDQLDSLLAGTAHPLRTVIALGGWAGLRIGEVLGLCWADVDLAEGLLTVRHQAQGGQLVPVKTSTSNAALPILSPLIAVLGDYRECWRPNDAGLLFATRAGRPMAANDVRDRLWHPARTRLGLPPMGLHALRHGLPRRLLKHLSPQAVMRLMRHQDLKMTAKYHHYGAVDLRREIAASTIHTEAPEQSR
jgi:integrase